MLRQDHPRFHQMVSRHRALCSVRKIKFTAKIVDLSTTRYLHRCHCGHAWKQTISNFVGRTGCPACAMRRFQLAGAASARGKPAHTRLTKGEFLKRLPKGYRLIGSYSGQRELVSLKCPQGHIRRTTADNAHRYGCGVCSGVEVSLDSHNKQLAALNDRVRCLQYFGARTASRYHCLQCKFRWSCIPTNILKTKRCHCPSCQPPGVTVRCVKLGRRKVLVRGYEPQALNYLIQVKGYKPNQIRTELEGTVPRIKVNGRLHKPDFFIPSDNRLVEVKSIFTLGLNGELYFKRAFQKLKTNHAKAREAGYRYNLLVFLKDGTRVDIPSKWYLLSTEQMRQLLRQQ